ncbi:hypothetical protein B9Z55_027271 [Caenorhabditis nigoni]|nr:hypothetical protein B9Z55_027271 [Caenorhabditis nigoni]
MILQKASQPTMSAETSDAEKPVPRFGRFPIVRLPILIIEESLNIMKIEELIELSSTSKNMRKLTTRRLQHENLHLNIHFHLNKRSVTIALQKIDGDFVKNVFIIQGQNGKHQNLGPGEKKLIRESHWDFGPNEKAYVRFMNIGVISEDVRPIISFFLIFAASCSIKNEAHSRFVDTILKAARNFPLQKCSTVRPITPKQLNGLVKVCDGQIDGFKGTSKDLNAFLKRWMRQTTPFYKFLISLEQIDMEHVLEQIEVKVVDKPMGLNEEHHQNEVSQWYEMTRDDNLTVVVYNYGSTFEMINKERI